MISKYYCQSTISPFHLLRKMHDLPCGLDEWKIDSFKRIESCLSSVHWRRCEFCSVKLLNGFIKESSSFCCGNGRYIIQKLPFIVDEPLQQSFLSPTFHRDARSINHLLSFAQQSVHGEGWHDGSPIQQMKLEGRTYHYLPRSGLNQRITSFFKTPSPGFNTIFGSNYVNWLHYLQRTNRFWDILKSFCGVQEVVASTTENVSVQNEHGTVEFTLHYGNVEPREQSISILNPALGYVASPRNLIATWVSDAKVGLGPTNPWWEPLQYPLLFPHGTEGTITKLNFFLMKIFEYYQFMISQGGMEKWNKAMVDINNAY